MNNDQSVTIRIDTDLKKALQIHAQNDGTTISRVMKKLAIEYARKNKLIKWGEQMEEEYDELNMHEQYLDTCPTCGDTFLWPRDCACDANLDEEQHKEKYRD